MASVANIGKPCSHRVVALDAGSHLEFSSKSGFSRYPVGTDLGARSQNPTGIDCKHAGRQPMLSPLFVARLAGRRWVSSKQGLQARTVAGDYLDKSRVDCQRSH
jgi:hypothetical protein